MVPSKAGIVSNLRKGGSLNLHARGGGRVKKSKIFADVINGSLLIKFNQGAPGPGGEIWDTHLH